MYVFALSPSLKVCGCVCVGGWVGVCVCMAWMCVCVHLRQYAFFIVCCYFCLCVAVLITKEEDGSRNERQQTCISKSDTIIT